MKYQNEELKTLKSKLRKWCRSMDTVFWLESNNLTQTNGVGKYELLVGVGVKSYLEIETHQNETTNSINDFWKDTSWKFFALSYDLKNTIHSLSSQNNDVLDWPLLYAIKPKIVISVTSQGLLNVFGVGENEFLNELDSMDTIKPDKFDIQYSSLSDSMSENEHFKKVLEIKDHIAEGDMYEMNLCMETVLNNMYCSNPLELFNRLNKQSPTPFASFVKTKNRSVICASPERYLAKRGDRIYSQPIKGTSKCYNDEALDYQSKLHLANSIKERAEHVMIVDLVRNDLSRICLPGSVRVDELFGIYKFKQVFQMISTISGKLIPELLFSDFLNATYPMGSMTGAPKHIVMKFIDRIETSARGWYSGTVGYTEPNGDFDSNVVIRSILYDDEKRVGKYSVGGAITFDSDPTLEYEECKLKSQAIRDVLSLK